jgi:hypothetical protein
MPDQTHCWEEGRPKRAVLDSTTPTLADPSVLRSNRYEGAEEGEVRYRPHQNRCESVAGPAPRSGGGQVCSSVLLTTADSDQPVLLWTDDARCLQIPSSKQEEVAGRRRRNRWVRAISSCPCFRRACGTPLTSARDLLVSSCTYRSFSHRRSRANGSNPSYAKKGGRRTRFFSLSLSCFFSFRNPGCIGGDCMANDWLREARRNVSRSSLVSSCQVGRKRGVRWEREEIERRALVVLGRYSSS